MSLGTYGFAAILSPSRLSETQTRQSFVARKCQGPVEAPLTLIFMADRHTLIIGPGIGREPLLSFVIAK